MIESLGNPEKEPKRDDAAKLATLYYYVLDRAYKLPGPGFHDIAGDIEAYMDFRAEQDPEMGHAIVNALESFRDPDPTLATLDAARDIQQQANSIRETLGLLPADLPTELPPPIDR